MLDNAREVDPDLEMFARLAVMEPRLRTYLHKKFDAEVKILVRNPADAQLHQSQGRAQAYEGLMALLDQKRV